MRTLLQRLSRPLTGAALTVFIAAGLGAGRSFGETPLGPRIGLPERTLKLPGLKIDPHGQTDPEKPPPPPEQQPGQPPRGSNLPMPNCSVSCTQLCKYQGQC